MTQSSTQLYQVPSGALEIRIDSNRDNIWLTQDQVAQIFEIHQSVVSRHIKNIFKDSEVAKDSNMQKMHNAISG